MLFVLLVPLFVICISCTDSTSSNSGNGLPSEFPLEEGNAWIYERVGYENGIQNTTLLDTLYIAGKYEDYFLYSWNPESYYSLIKNYDSKLIDYGIITNSDTIFYDVPHIWNFYGVSGNLDSTNYVNYDFSNIDSAYISVLSDEEYFDKTYDTYLFEERYLTPAPYFRMNLYINRLGYVYFEYFDEDDNLMQTIRMLEKLENFYPPMININNTIMSKSSNYKQNGINYNR